MRNIYGNVQLLAATTHQNTPYRANIIIIASPSNADMAVRRNNSVGGIKIYPSPPRCIHTDPSVRNVGAHQAGFSGRRRCIQVTAHISGREPHGPQAANLELRKILAHAAAGAQDLSHWRLQLFVEPVSNHNLCGFFRSNRAHIPKSGRPGNNEGSA